MANGYFTNLFQNWHLSIYKKRLLVRRFNTLGGLHVILQMTTILLLDSISLLKRGLLWKERICFHGEQILSFRSRPLFRRTQNNFNRVTTPESIPSPFNCKNTLRPTIKILPFRPTIKVLRGLYKPWNFPFIFEVGSSCFWDSVILLFHVIKNLSYDTREMVQLRSTAFSKYQKERRETDSD